MTTWEKHETALKELSENNAGNLTVDMVMGYLYEQGMLASQLEPQISPACGKWQNAKPEKSCYFIHRYTPKDNKPALYDAYIDGGILSVANIQDDEFICTMEEFTDGEFYIIEYH